MPWYAAHATVTGSAHRKLNLPCQDFSAFAILDEVALGVVSDGAGSAARSDIGARVAVETMLEHIKGKAWNLTPPVLDEAKLFFAEGSARVLKALQTRAEAEGCCEADLACTLIAFFATPGWLAAMQIGDGLLVARAPEGNYELLLKPDKGEYINETTFVTSPLAAEQMQVCVRHGEFSFVCAATDGIESVSIRYQDWTPHIPFFEPLEQYMRSRPSPEEGAADVAEFLDRPKLNARSDDDKTMLLYSYMKAPSRLLLPSEDL